MEKKNEALNSAMKQIEKQFGKGSIMMLGEEADKNIEASSSGSLALDIALGIGGYPKGSIKFMDLRLAVKPFCTSYNREMQTQKLRRFYHAGML